MRRIGVAAVVGVIAAVAVLLTSALSEPWHTAVSVGAAVTLGVIVYDVTKGSD